MEEAAQIIEEIRQINVQYRREVGSKRRPWPHSIKKRISVLVSLGLSFKEISEKTEVPYYSIMNWRHGKNREKKPFHSLMVTKAKPVEDSVVTVTASSRVPQANLKAATVTVTTPDGYRIEVEGAAVAAELLRVLRETGRV